MFAKKNQKTKKDPFHCCKCQICWHLNATQERAQGHVKLHFNVRDEEQRQMKDVASCLVKELSLSAWYCDSKIFLKKF